MAELEKKIEDLETDFRVIEEEIDRLQRDRSNVLGDLRMAKKALDNCEYEG